MAETIETLGVGIERMASLIDRLLASIEKLDGNVDYARADWPDRRLRARQPPGQLIYREI
ncbi:MAG TPA: hypothetical protein VMJ65_17750 [Solirubrobacteraceae bacterium]|nr:hypothetical protein [Solirubrobacteraceae bacterium]